MKQVFDIRERLNFMSKAPMMCAVTREASLVQVMTWLIVAGADGEKIRSLERVGVSPKIPSSLVDVEHLMTRLQVPEDPWAKDIVSKALDMIPEPCVVTITL
jgi:hypothetical protein